MIRQILLAVALGVCLWNATEELHIRHAQEYECAEAWGADTDDQEDCLANLHERLQY